MPKQKRYSSKQNYQTPEDLIHAVKTIIVPKCLEEPLGTPHDFDIDLAAEEKNKQAKNYYSEQDNSLIQDWSQYKSGVCWLNPPFSNIRPWAEKCHKHCQDFHTNGGIILFLTPASVGSVWFAEHVHNIAMVLALIGRPIFVGEKNGFPKDCMLSIFGVDPGFNIWRWK